MRASLYSLASLVLSMATSAFAEGREGIVQNSFTGCDISGVTSSNGFKVKIYSYTYDDMSDYTNTAYFNGEYTSNYITSADFVTNPNFVYDAGASTTETGTEWGLDIPITNFVAEFTGYFYGMFF
jgi:hypothetical protein